MVETWWAIGSTPGGDDVQPFISVGTNTFIQNTSLEGMLFEDQTYYVTLICLNGAGLQTVNSSQGELYFFPIMHCENVSKMADASPLNECVHDVLQNTQWLTKSNLLGTQISKYKISNTN